MSPLASRSAFVIMPFSPEFEASFDDVIEPAVRAAGLECIRADQEALGHIHQMMFERIFESAAVVADVSGGNPNVFYELGVCHTTARKTVTVTRGLPRTDPLRHRSIPGHHLPQAAESCDE